MCLGPRRGSDEGIFVLTNELEKVSWWGCGKHVPMVMDNVPEAERCSCKPQVEREGKMYPPMAEKAD